MIFRTRDMVARIKAQPFVPFRVMTTSGRAYEVRHPELAWIAPGFMFIGVPKPNYPESGVIDEFVQVALMHISEVEPMIPGEPPTENTGDPMPVR